ncbi:MAG: cytochrome c oxidase subunit 4 [Candidatus Limnocylindrales bacterium]|nr:cytochrome c oxidase subunit 4 [Candidatus Limnocylindrales bacterium]
MLEQLWNGILELVSQFVIPDWGGLVALLPVGIVILVAIGLIWTFRRLMTAAPARRGIGRVPPTTPAGIHMPGPSLAPIFAAIGVFLLFLGLVFGGVALALGAIALVLTLLYWLAEGLRVYDRDIEPTRTILPARVDAVPPPGVHMPGPSFRPIMGALGTALLLLGLVFGGWLLAVGVFALVAGLIGWLADARKEYVKTVEADRTGHLEGMPAPRPPSRLFATLAVLVVAAAVLQSGVLTTGPASGGTPGASESPGGSAAPPHASGAPASGAPASGEPGGPTADVKVEAKGVAFVQGSWAGPADKPFTIAFDNEDPGTPHNIALKDSSGAEVWKGDIINGVETRVYDVPALPAGQYTFACSVHSNMSGTATLQ